MDMSRFELPSAAIVHELLEGRQPTFLAAAFDVKTCFIKQIAITYVDSLLKANRRHLPAGKHGAGLHHRSYRGVICELRIFLNSRRAAFCDILTTRELAEVAEVTSYLKAFATSHLGEDHEQQAAS